MVCGNNFSNIHVVPKKVYLYSGIVKSIEAPAVLGHKNSNNSEREYGRGFRVHLDLVQGRGIAWYSAQKKVK